MKHRHVLLFLLFALVVCAPAARAALILELSIEFSGATPPAGPGPWLRAEFNDVIPGTVDVTLTSLLTEEAEFVNLWMFNLNPAYNPNNLSFLQKGGGPPAGSISTGVNAFQANGDGRFDILFDFPMNPVASRFNDGDFVTYRITSSSDPITSASFDFFSDQDGGIGTFKSAAHVQGTEPGGQNSGWIAVPEPATALLAAVGLTLMRRRRFCA